MYPTISYLMAGKISGSVSGGMIQSGLALSFSLLQGCQLVWRAPALYERRDQGNLYLLRVNNVWV